MSDATWDVTVCELVHGLPVGGAEVLVDRFVRELGRERRVIVACLDEVGELGEGLRQDGFDVFELDRRPGLDWGCSRRLARLLRAERVDVVHAHQYTPFCYALLARLGRRRPPIVFTEHGRFHPDHPRRTRIVFNRLLTRRDDRFLGVGENVRQALVDNEGLPPERVGVVYNGIDLSPFEVAVEERAAIRESLRREIGVGEEACVVLQVARLDHLKDHATAIRAFERLAADVPGAHLVLVGEGPERGLIEREIAERGLEACVTLLGLRRDVARLLFAADVFLLSSISEGIPLTVIEAMAAGLPVVSTDVGGIREILGAPVVGRLAAAGDDAGLAAGLIELANDAAMRQSLGATGRKRTFATFSERVMHAEYGRILDEACGVGGIP